MNRQITINRIEYILCFITIFVIFNFITYFTNFLYSDSDNLRGTNYINQLELCERKLNFEKMYFNSHIKHIKDMLQQNNPNQNEIIKKYLEDF